AYEGRAGGPGRSRRAIGCGGLGIDVTGAPNLGEAMRFTASGLGGDAPGFLVGVPATPFPLCFGCSVGLDPNGFLVAFPGLATLDLPLTRDPGFVGVPFGVQGYAIGSGTC